MRGFIIHLTVFLLIAPQMMGVEPAKPAGSEERKLQQYVAAQRNEMVRVTREPLLTLKILDCAPPAFVQGPHDQGWIHVFTTHAGTNAMLTGKGAYPTNTLILKQKFSDAKATKPDFYTGMRKREHGYNPQAGDWEFFVLNSRADTVLARGRIESCADCHSKFAATDFVARTYLRK
jgi:hypothetical protein